VSVIGIALLTFATALAVRMRRVLQPAAVMTSGGASDMLLPASDDNIVELESQGSPIKAAVQKFDAALEKKRRSEAQHLARQRREEKFNGIPTVHPLRGLIAEWTSNGDKNTNETVHPVTAGYTTASDSAAELPNLVINTDKVDAIRALATDSIKELSSRNSHHLGELLGKTPFASVLLTPSARPAIFALTPHRGTPGVYAAALELANKLKSQQQPAPPKQLPTDLHCPSNWPTFLAALTRQAGAVTLGAGLMASTAFPSYAADTLLLADKQPGQIQYQQLEDCAKSAKFQKRRTKSTGAIEARMAKYEPGSPPYLALEQTLNQTNARFQRYADSNVLCGKDGLPHLIVDGDPEYFAQFVFPGLGFLYTAGYIGTAGRKYIRTVSKTKNPAEKEIIIEVPLALSIMLSNYLWPVDAWKEFLAGDLVANKEEITVSPR
jgi:photosystem I subunit 3